MRCHQFCLLCCFLACLTAPACASESSSREGDPSDAGQTPSADASGGDHGQDAAPPDGEADAGADAGDRDPPDSDERAHLQACYVPAEWGRAAFDDGAKYTTPSIAGAAGEEQGYEFLAADEFEGGYRQQLWVEIYPRSQEAALTGSFDLAAEDFTYATCERCVLIAAGISEDQTKYFLAASGTLELTRVTTSEIAGTLADVTLVEVAIDAATNETRRVENGCTTHIAHLDFGYAPPELPEHIAACFVPESISSQAFRGFIYELTANAARGEFFYRAREVPAAGSGMPSMILYVEVWQGGTGTFDLSTSEDHNVLVEAVMPDGRQRGYAAISGELVLSALSQDLMEGQLRDVHLQAAEITEDAFSLIEGDECATEIPSLAFSSADATSLDD